MNQYNNKEILSLGVTRSMDIIMYVLFSDDQNFIRDMVTKVTHEVANDESCQELHILLQHNPSNPLLYQCLFFLMLDFHAGFRYWVLQEDNSMGLRKICPYKAATFLKVLRDELVPHFLMNETMRLDDFGRAVKVEYIRS